MSGTDPQRILLVRNDNIGDLICSIPSIQLVRRNFPQASIHLLVNNYNAEVVEPLVPQWVDRLIVYRKTKHTGLSPGQLLHLIRFYADLRRQRYDAVLLLLGGKSRQAVSFARWTGAAQVIGYDLGIEGLDFSGGRHEVEYSWKLAAHLCRTNALPPSCIDYPIRQSGQRLAVQITSRKHGNRWDAARFAELGEKLAAARSEKAWLLWSPGDARTPTHPGDDEKAAEILRLAPDAFAPHPTATLTELIATLKECHDLITPDGGAMHLAAAMGLRIVAMFGQSEPERWRPWTPDCRILQSPSRTIQDISVEQVLQAWKSLCR
jgi:ADP-heptose:LPS heptosyltransferase